MDDPTRLEKMVGELLGLRLMLGQLVANEAKKPGGGALIAELRTAALEVAETWPIGSDTPEGGERIRHCLRAMLTHFPEPTKLS